MHELKVGVLYIFADSGFHDYTSELKLFHNEIVSENLLFTDFILESDFLVLIEEKDKNMIDINVYDNTNDDMMNIDENENMKDKYMMDN
ncbi:856_t:CDS:2 [Racocetra persica]|uniref:856_t:CDS:1 n=1 Tax=Racocetra persica TaxID=160502 RepID=A0ACA9KMG2_9GLOM|nr:856_t:CDS:2 [Racocetra persica]